jgi:azurin
MTLKPTRLLNVFLCITCLTLALPFASADKGKSATSKNSETIKITLLGTDQMQFDKKELKVSKGSTIELTLRHSGKLPVNVMGHNFVLLKPGVDIAKFAMEAMQAKDTGYVLPKQAKDVIAKTGLVGGGASTTVTFKAPSPGTYDYICTFPGHYAMMKGKLVVE